MKKTNKSFKSIGQEYVTTNFTDGGLIAYNIITGIEKFNANTYIVGTSFGSVFLTDLKKTKKEILKKEDCDEVLISSQKNYMCYLNGHNDIYIYSLSKLKNHLFSKKASKKKIESLGVNYQIERLPGRNKQKEDSSKYEEIAKKYGEDNLIHWEDKIILLRDEMGTLSKTNKHKIMMWDINTWQIDTIITIDNLEYFGYKKIIYTIDSENHKLLLGNFGGVFYSEFELESYSVKNRVCAPNDYVASTITYDSNNIVCGTNKSSIIMINRTDSSVINEIFIENYNYAHELTTSISPNKTLVAADDENYICLFNIYSFEPIAIFEYPNYSVYCGDRKFRWDETSKYLFSVCYGGIQVFDIEHQSLILNYKKTRAKDIVNIQLKNNEILFTIKYYQKLAETIELKKK